MALVKLSQKELTTKQNEQKVKENTKKKRNAKEMKDTKEGGRKKGSCTKMMSLSVT
jgi:hypothetical protein